MKNVKMYEAGDKMISVIRDNYNILQAMNSFGIYLGFGDKTVDEVCKEQGVDTYTFLAVINYTVNGYEDQQGLEKISIPTLLKYLQANHDYYLDFQLPMIRTELIDSLDENDNLARLILKLYDEYAHGVTVHMRYEEKHVFPYVRKLLDGETSDAYDIDTYSNTITSSTRSSRNSKTSSSNICLPTDLTTTNSWPRSIIYIIMRSGCVCIAMWRTTSSSPSSAISKARESNRVWNSALFPE